MTWRVRRRGRSRGRGRPIGGRRYDPDALTRTPSMTCPTGGRRHPDARLGKPTTGPDAPARVERGAGHLRFVSLIMALSPHLTRGLPGASGRAISLAP